MLDVSLSPPLLSALSSQCTDSLFEMIDLRALPDMESEGEKFGVPRVVEALESHMWRHMVRKDGSGKRKKEKEAEKELGEKVDEREGGEGVRGEKEVHAEYEGKQASSSPSPSLSPSPLPISLSPSSSVDVSSDPSIGPVSSFSSLLTDIHSSLSPSPLSSFPPPPSSSSSSHPPSLFDLLSVGEGEGEGEGDDLLTAMRVFQQLRGIATSLPDEERRELAAKVALGFASLLCGDEEEDEEGVGEEE